MAKTLCPVRILLDQFSDRWAVLAILSLKEGPVRFNALRRNLDGITQKVLGQTLQRLAQNGLVDRNVLATKPVAVEYKLSELGMSLLPLLEQIRRWALKHEAPLLSARQKHAISIGS
jgi:DNA-binding HxlR family transcriptional regulator